MLSTGMSPVLLSMGQNLICHMHYFKTYFVVNREPLSF